MKKLIVCWLLAGSLLCGCGMKKGIQEPAPAGDPEVVVLSTSPIGADEGARYGVYSLDGGEQSEDYANYDSDTADENALLVREGAVFRLTNSDINKTGDSARSLFSGLNAAIAAVSGAELILDNCTLTSNGLLATGLFCAGEDTRAQISASQLVTAGGGSPALVLADGGSAHITGSRLMAEAADTPLIAVQGEAQLLLSGCTLQFAGAYAAEVREGLFTLTLDAQQLTGDILLSAESETPASLALTLKNGAAFAGHILSNGEGDIDVSLDESSTWTLTGELSISAIAAPDTGFAGIQSNGFNIYYNSGLEANAWLNAQAYKLPGGGYLSPLI